MAERAPRRNLIFSPSQSRFARQLSQRESQDLPPTLGKTSSGLKDSDTIAYDPNSVASDSYYDDGSYMMMF